MLLRAPEYYYTYLLLLVKARQNNGTMCPTYIFIIWRHFVARYVQPVIQQYECFKKNFRNQCSRYENYGRFLLGIEAITCLPQNRHFLWWAKMNGTQRRALISPWRMHCMYSGMAKGTSQAEATMNSEKNQACSLSHCQVT